ncbi:nonstructural protein [Uriurana virus]|uniref:Nonstructural protein n=1 Tax=Uriurana virus TaxID=1055750 RepID=I1T375_9VIRU|nr:nonstructural protein [Uriurana virus]YP_010839708.1 nonstructural protein [Uriurana virus]AEL29692.1 nonstructural protein [Uriurana virus]API68898.1 nonstructural protein [Uriurana virus]
MNFFAVDYPLVSFSVNKLRRIQVDYVPYCKEDRDPISLYDCLEFPVTSFTQVPGIRSKLRDYYDFNQLPVSWGPAKPGVSNESSTKFSSLISKIADLEVTDCLKHNEPNIKRALSWPYSYPSLLFFKLSAKKDDYGIWEYKGLAMTSIMRASKVTQIDRCVVFFHKKILREAMELGEPEGEYPGRDLFLECASVICVRLLRAYKYDLIYDEPHSKLLKLIREFDETFLLSTTEPHFGIAKDEFDTSMKRQEAEETFWGSDFTDSD